MKSWFWKGMLAAAIALAGAERCRPGRRERRFRMLERDAQGRIRLRCYLLHPAPSSEWFAEEVVTGIKVFDGHGNLTQRDYAGDNLAGPDFAPRGQETGTYQVNSDCTGSMVINLNVPNVPQAPPPGSSTSGL